MQTNQTDRNFDVVIIGGGPAGSTCAGLLKKYSPELRVAVYEAAKFPRDHVGESQLPPVTRVLQELGCWDKVEAAGFPVKTGALYRWGNSDDLWRFDFLIGQEYQELPRPGQLEGQRLETTFHVERSIFDKILLDHAAELGAEIYEEHRLTKVTRTGDRIDSVTVSSSQGDFEVTAKIFVDASGHIGALRRALGVKVEEPTSLKNVAFWTYWNKPEWAQIEGVGKGGARVRVISIGTGWIWFIPLSSERVSVGFVTHAEHYKASGLRPDKMYAEALLKDEHIRGLMEGATQTGPLESTKDWSFLAERMEGENWFLVGESAGFADPILAGGMTLAMTGAREAAYIIKAILSQDLDADWLCDYYTSSQRKRIGQHIRFADFWYSANAHFTELKEFTSKIASDAGLSLQPEEAFRWLGTGGFASDDLSSPIVGTYRLGAAKIVMGELTGVTADWQLNKFNEYKLNLVGAVIVEVPWFEDGTVHIARCYERGSQILPLIGMYDFVLSWLQKEKDATRLIKGMRQELFTTGKFGDPLLALHSVFDAIEGMIAEGWIKARYNPNRPQLQVSLDATSLSVETP